MIQEQATSPQPQQYEQVQFINTSDQPVFITALEAFSNNFSNRSTIPIVIQQTRQQQQQPQLQSNKHLINQKKIILITSPNTTVLKASNQSKNLNLNQAKVHYQTLQAIPRATTSAQTRVISPPFLPRWPSTTHTVKENSPIKEVSVKTAHQETHSSINHLKKTLTPKPAIISIDTVSSSNLNSFNSCKSKSQTMSKPKIQPTLATMAGIQLTGSVESLPAAMSGAMQNAHATVEEINVPVFIDEYLQQTSPATEAATNNFNNNINSNPEGLATNLTDNGNGTEAYCIDGSNFFEEFEFDIEDLITADDSKESSTTAAATTATEVTNICVPQQQQKMYNMYGFSNNNNYNNNITDINTNYDDSFASFLNEINVKSECFKNEVEEFEEAEEQQQHHSQMQAQYHLLPQLNIEESFPADDTLLNLDGNNEMCQIQLTEEAVNFTNATDIELSHILMSSQNNPMFSGCCLSATNTQNFAIANTEPISPELTIDVLNAQSTLLDVIKMEAVNVVESDECDAGITYVRSQSNATKRTTANGQSQTTTMQEKRRKLLLDTTTVGLAPNNDFNNTLSTPGIIELIDNMDTDKHHTLSFNHNAEDIMNNLLGVSNSSFNESTPRTPFTYVSSYDDSEIDDMAPSTPQSCQSSSYSNNTHNTFTSPNSPALSSVSSTATRTTKSKRGRPPKAHSDKPDLSKLRHLSESEIKRLEDRAKNNEASRLSRLKNKQREEQEMAEENSLVAQNIKLKQTYELLHKKEEKLKRAFHRCKLQQQQQQQLH